jgi:hypothetical protein
VAVACSDGSRVRSEPEPPPDLLPNPASGQRKCFKIFRTSVAKYSVTATSTRMSSAPRPLMTVQLKNKEKLVHL